VKFITLFAGALVVTTAANVLLASDAYAGFPPNGWTQVGKSCCYLPASRCTTDYYKLRKNSNKSVYGVYANGWVGSKDLTLEQANTKMNDKCGVTKYQPT
jgi:hypothetical protein